MLWSRRLPWALAAMCLVLVCAFGAQSVDDDDTKPINVHFSLANKVSSYGSSPQLYAISWLTKHQTGSTVVYSTSSTLSSPHTVKGSSSSYDHLEGWNHDVLLPPLTPSTRYYYRVGNDTNWSSTLSFVTLDAKPMDFTLAVVGDMGVDRSENVIKVLNDVSVNGSISGVIHVGDISYANDHPLSYEKTWNDWFSSLSDTMTRVPYMVCPGNHESWCRNPVCAIQTKNFTTFKHKFRMPFEESGGENNMWYSFDVGPVHFISISTESDYPNPPFDPSPYSGKRRRDEIVSYPQLEWLQADLEMANARRHLTPWIIMYGHRSPYGEREGQPQGQEADVQAAFEPLMHKYGVDLYLAGHLHCYKRLWPIYNGTVTQMDYKEYSGTAYMVTGAGGSIEGLDNATSSPSWWPFVDGQQEGFALMRIVNTTHINWKYVRADTNSVEDEIWLSRKPVVVDDV